MRERRSHTPPTEPAVSAAPAEGGMRADLAMVARGLAPSRARAQDLIRRGLVRLDGAVVAKPGATVAAHALLTLAAEAPEWVSRGAEKLIAGLDTFGFDPAGLYAVDLGASTGGFTEVLLHRGARRVLAADVGHGQLHPRIAADPRVAVREGLNVRYLAASDLEEPPMALVADVSFISLMVALPAALDLAGEGAFGVFLVKPQFEVGRDGLSKGGLVRDPARAAEALATVRAWLDGRPGWRVVGEAPSPIAGGDGNREFLLGARKDR
ncbi:23S rRNA (cytidine1920-2'-O)/16S rRNA (cytidine1409-2'-O)-methyltransferase [Pseudoxanthobacter soli DSM 19599]|uniref:23S rRNA (Cytidine1920-2'-O)/16S rRNA (Cytidine1409-2'-O)-methyltransferase n=2 Tax=Pseudoxanthobacter TaxID=433838 RepID=A0A1M7ZQ98_9HYPH|nr:23S rRNA (cytidine1920-2'-O)/16S rRNA (cytidine1409-2'-O)-methyltransferase [Pseudoxanthobacter soli DSM 19599]